MVLRIIVVIIGLALIIVGCVLWIKNPDSTLIPIVMTGVGLALSFFPLVLLIPTKVSRSPHKKQKATLTIIADRSKTGQEVNLLPSEYWDNLTRYNHWAVEKKRVVELIVRRRQCFGVVFRDVTPAEYMVWTNEGDETPVDISAGETKVIHLSQRWLGNVK